MRKIYLFFPFILIGCVSSTYKLPSGEKVAHLTVTTKTLGTVNQQVRIFNSKDCSDYPGQLVNLLQSKMIGNDTKDSTETTIKAGEPITLSVYAGIPRDDSVMEMFFKGVERVAAENALCEAFITFTPEAGAKYSASYKIDGSPCSIFVMRVDNGQALNVTSSSTNEQCAIIAKSKSNIKLLTN